MRAGGQFSLCLLRLQDKVCCPECHCRVQYCTPISPDGSQSEEGGPSYIHQSQTNCSGLVASVKNEDQDRLEDSEWGNPSVAEMGKP
jgi:hypothetical protein